MAIFGRSFPGTILIRGPIITSQSWTTFQGAATFSANTTFGATAFDIVNAVVAQFVATASLTPAAFDITSGTAIFVASASLSVTAIQSFFATSTWNATSTLTAGGIATPQGTATLSVSAALSITGPQETQQVTVTLSGTAGLTNVPGQGVQASSSWSATTTLAAASMADLFATSAWSATAHLSTDGTLVQPAAANLSGTAALTVVPVLVQEAQATLSATSALTIVPGNYYLVSSAWTATSALTVTAQGIYAESASLIAVSGFTIGLLVNSPITIPLVAVSGLTASPTVVIGITQPVSYYLRQSQNWAVVQEQQRHAQAMYMVGEMTCFILMWHEIDFLMGLVQRCQTCYDTSNALTNRIVAVYNQPHINKCPDCFGTTFEGGYRARIVRPAILTDTDETEKPDQRGSVHPDDMNVETTWDFRSRAGDYMLRADGSRWRLSNPQRTTLRTGFAYPSQINTAIAYGNIRATYEEVGTVVYNIPPTNSSQLAGILTAPAFFPPDFSSFEIIRAPLIPQSIEG